MRYKFYQQFCLVIAKINQTFYQLSTSSAALAVSGLPFMEPIAASRVGYKDGKYLLNPSVEELKASELDLVKAGTKDAVLMVESETSGYLKKLC